MALVFSTHITRFKRSNNSTLTSSSPALSTELSSSKRPVKPAVQLHLEPNSLLLSKYFSSKNARVLSKSTSLGETITDDNSSTGELVQDSDGPFPSRELSDNSSSRLAQDLLTPRENQVAFSSRQSSRKPASRKQRRYAAPAVYAHLNGLPDLLEPKLDVVFCGINPGCRSATVSHYYAHPTNHFWKCLHLSGLTPTCLSPDQDRRLPRDFGLGLTDLVSRPTAEASELSVAERLAAVPVLLRKLLRFRPRILCFVGVKQYQDLCAYFKKHLTLSINLSSGHLGLQNIFLSYRINPPGLSSNAKCALDPGLQHTLVFVTPSTSALVRKYKGPERVAFFTSLRECKDALIQSPKNPPMVANSQSIIVEDLLAKPESPR